MIKNIISSFFSRAFIAVFNLGILLICSRQLGSFMMGEISLLILNIAIVQSIVEIFTGSSLVYFIPKVKVRKVYQYGIVWLIVASAICNFMLIGFKIGPSNLSMHVFALSIILSLHAFHLIILLGKEQIKTYNFLSMIQPLLLFISLLVNVVVLQNHSIEAYLYAIYTAAGLSLCFSSLALLLSKTTQHQDLERFNLKASVVNGSLNQLANLSHTLSNRLNYYLLGASALVGVYAGSSSLTESLWIISAGISPMLLAHVANQRNANKQAQLTLILSKLSFLLGFIGACIIYCLPSSFFVFLLGSDFEQAKQVMIFLIPGILFVNFSSVMSHYFSGKGLQKVQLTANLAGLSVALCSSWWLIQKFGIMGACISASFSYATQALVLVYVFFKQSHLPFSALFTFKGDLHLLKKDTIE